jgi:erythromycin esterase-like protein
MLTTSEKTAGFSPEDGDRIATLRAHAEHLAPVMTADFADPFDRFGGAKLVLLGEATHGTAEFYRGRAAITRRLIEKHAFNIVALEADWPDAARIDRYVRHRAPEGSRDEIFRRFPEWMWRNEEFREFVDWLREFNEPLPPDRRVELRGLDVYSLGASMDAVLRYLDHVDSDAAARARDRYGCLTPWQQQPAEYGAAAISGDVNCEREAVDQLCELLQSRLEYSAKDAESFFDAAQNARIVRAAEEYYRTMYRGSVASWNLRDRHMFDSLRRLMDARGPDARAVVWAHNSHIGNAAATAMGWEGEFNIGELARARFGNDMVAIGFGTDRGKVAAASSWDYPMRIMNVLPARNDSYEALFRQTPIPRSLTDWTAPQRQELRDALSGSKLERAIGVVYRPDTELMSHYFKAVMAEQFDAFVWFEETSPITPIGSLLTGQETYPQGL